MSFGEGDGSSNKLSEVQKLCLGLQSDDKRARKQVLIGFERYLSNRDNFTPQEYHDVFKEAHIHLLNMLRDKSEPVREQAIKFTKFYLIDILPMNNFYLSYLFPVLIERIGTVELIEESEEIRLQLVQLLQDIIEKYTDVEHLKPFLNDFVVIFKETVQDKYPAVKELSCKCIVNLALALPKDFHKQAVSLVKPVLTAFTHQRFKIRVEAIKCIGEIVLHSEYKALEEVIAPMSERLFDQIPIVRRTIAQVTARWLLEYRDRYSFFPKLLPLILTGLNDEVPETRDETYRLWIAVGMQYQKENEKDLKDQLDYLTEMPKYYPANLVRPNLGCRAMVQRAVMKLAPALAREFSCWQADVRFRCSQLLCSLVHHAEEGLTQHMQELLNAMYSASRDEDERVIANIIQASELMGVFVPTDTWKKMILPTIEDGPHFGHLTVLAALIRGTPQEYIASSLREIAQLLADTSIRYSRKMKYQKELINCVKAIESKYTTELSDDIGQYLFNIIVTILSIKDNENVSIDFDLLESLRETLQFECSYNLWSKFVPLLLESIKKDPKSWTEVTIERCIFEVILTNSNEAFGENLDVIGEILVECLDLEVEAESRLKTFVAFTAALDTKDVIFKRAKALQVFLEKIITEILVPTLVWHAGRTAEAMRTMAASCLASALSPGVEIELFKDKTVLRTLVNRLIPLLLSLSEDAAYRSRYLALGILILLKDNLMIKNDWQNDDLLKIYPEIVKRLDDPIDSVRIGAIKSLNLLFENAPDEFKGLTFRAHHELLLDTLMTHFDDDNRGVRNLVYDTLQTMANFCPDVVEDKAKRHKPLIRNQDGCEEIIKYLKTLSC